MIDSRWVSFAVGDQYFILDTSEQRYGKDVPVLMLNAAGNYIFELLKHQPAEQALASVLSQYDSSYSHEDIAKAFQDVIQALEEAGVLPEDECGRVDARTIKPTTGFGLLKQAWSKVRQPSIAIVEITGRCNLYCPHCYAAGVKTELGMTSGQLKEVASILKEKGVLIVTMTGGEPMARPDFKDIYLEFKRKGFLIDLYSNGTLIDEDMADFLAANPPRVIDVSLYGLSDEEYLKNTGLSDGFTRLDNALKMLSSRNVNVMTKMVVTKNNYDSVLDYNAYAQSYGFPFRYNVVIGSRNDGRVDSTSMQISNEQLLALEEKDPLRRTMLQQLSRCTYLDDEAIATKRYPKYMCGAGVGNVFIGYDGKMSPCMTLRGKGIDLFDRGFDAIWEEWGERRKERFDEHFKCIDCKYMPLCTPCVEEFEQLNGSADRPIEQRCELAKMRWNRFVQEGD